MAVQYTFISINKSALIRNLTLFSIVAVDNHQLAQIIEIGERLLLGSKFLYQEELLSYICIVEQHVSSPLIFQACNVFLVSYFHRSVTSKLGNLLT